MTLSILLLAVLIIGICVVLVDRNGGNPFRGKIQPTKVSKLKLDLLPDSKVGKPDLKNLAFKPNLVYNLSEDTVVELRKTKRLGNVIKAPADKRQYRTLELRNQMKVIVVSDPETDKAAAAMNVMTGSFHDPDDLLGLAHYLEHMLFLGTKKFPENGFEKHLAQHAGSTNAYTKDEDTCYYFSLSPEGLDGALDRFSQFFIAPLFSAELNEREVNAVNSEYEGTLVSEYWRLDRVNRKLSKSDHPYSRFSVGNKNTLWHEPMNKSIDVRSELIKFFHDRYSSNVMSLVVIGRESLDDLEKMVEKYFGPTPNRHVSISRWPEDPWGPEELQRRIDIVPLMDLRELYISFPIPDWSARYKTGSLYYVRSLLSHKGPGSLYAFLKSKTWVTELYVSAGVEARGFGTFKLEISLTPKGLENVNEIILHIFQYLKMLEDKGPQSWYWKELQIIEGTAFKFKEKSESDNLVTELVAVMPYYPIEEVWTSNYLINDYQPTFIQEILTHLIPEKVRVITVTKENQKIATHKEEYMDIEYGFSRIDPKLIQKWKNCGTHNQLKFPVPNNFIPNVFDLSQRDNSTSNIPRIIVDGEMSRVWFLQDNEFKEPRASIAVYIVNPYYSKSARNENLQYLLTELIRDLLTEYSYSASSAGLSYSISTWSNGLSLKVSGYSDKSGDLFDHVLKFLLNFNESIRPEHGPILENIKESYARQLKNIEKDPPSSQGWYEMQYILSSHGSSVDQLLSNIVESNATIEDVIDYARLIFKKVRLEWMIYGNIAEKEAHEIHEKSLGHFRRVGAVPLEPSEIPLDPSIIKLPTGSSFRRKLKVKGQTQSGVHLYFQPELVDLRQGWVSLLILDQVLSEECFNILRTKEQLGYRVSCYGTLRGAFHGYEAIIQGPKHPLYSESRINNFLLHISETVNNMTAAEFKVYKNAVKTVIISAKRKTLISQSYDLEYQLSAGLFDFDKINEELKQLDRITLTQVQTFFNTWISPKSDKRKFLSIHVVSEEQKPMESTDQALESKSPEMIEDVEQLKKRLGFHGIPKPFMSIPTWRTSHFAT